MFKRYAQPLRRLGRKRTYRIPVIVLFNDSRATLARLEFEIVAHNAADAANWVRDHDPKVRGTPETEIRAWGPKGGEVYRYIDWESAIWTKMQDQRRDAYYKQIDLFV